MFKRSCRGWSAKLWMRWVRPSLEQLEARWLLSGITEFTAGITAASAPTAIVRGADGNFWFTEFNKDRIGRITPAGTVTEFILPAGSGPLDIVSGPDGKLYFTERFTNRIGRINPQAGSNVAIQSSFSDTFATGITAGSGPTSITIGPDSNLWFTEFNIDKVARLTLASSVVTEFGGLSAGSGPAGITSGPDGAVWFTEAGAGAIGRVTTSGIVTNEFLLPVATSDPENIVTAPNGVLYFTETGQDKIGRITTAGTITDKKLSTGAIPNDITVGTDNALYFTESGLNRIGRLTLGGSLAEFGSGITPGSQPAGITASPNGDIWFTENAGNAIGRLTPPPAQITVAATGSTIEVYDNHLHFLQSAIAKFTPFPGFRGPISVAVADVNGNGVPDIIVAASHGAGPHVKVFEGSDGSLLANFFAFAPSFGGGVFVAAGDVNGDGRADLIVSAGPHVKVIDGTKLHQVQAHGQIANSALLANFFAIAPSFGGGVFVAAGDINGDGLGDVIVGAGPGTRPRVKVIDGTRLHQVQANGQIAGSALLASFFAFAPGFTGGVFVAAGDVNGDGRADLVVGAGPGAAPRVRVIDGKRLNQVQANGQIANSALLASFFAFAPGFTGGVRVSADDLNGDGRADLIVGAGPGARPRVTVIDGAKRTQVQANGQIANSALVASFFATNPNFSGGVFVAAD